jgi:hypothetical protein
MDKTYERLTNQVYGITWVENIRAYQVDAAEDGSVTYMRFHPGDINDNCFMIRVVTEAGENDNQITTITCTVGAWADRRTIDEADWEPINGSKSLNPDKDGNMFG